MLINCVGQAGVINLDNVFYFYKDRLDLCQISEEPNVRSCIMFAPHKDKINTFWDFETEERRNQVFQWLLDNFSQQAPLAGE